MIPYYPMASIEPEVDVSAPEQQQPLLPSSIRANCFSCWKKLKNQLPQDDSSSSSPAQPLKKSCIVYVTDFNIVKDETMNRHRVNGKCPNCGSKICTLVTPSGTQGLPKPPSLSTDEKPKRKRQDKLPKKEEKEVVVEKKEKKKRAPRQKKQKDEVSTSGGESSVQSDTSGGGD